MKKLMKEKTFIAALCESENCLVLQTIKQSLEVFVNKYLGTIN